MQEKTKTLIILSPSQLAAPYRLQDSVRSFADSMATKWYGTYYASYYAAYAYVNSLYLYDQYSSNNLGGQLINNYKLGIINDDQFKHGMASRLRITEDQVVEGWNAGLGAIDQRDCNSLILFLTANASNKLVLVGNTNPMHYEAFKNNLQSRCQDLFNILNDGNKVINRMSFVSQTMNVQQSIEGIADHLASDGAEHVGKTEDCRLFSFNRYAQNAPRSLVNQEFRYVPFNYPDDAGTLGEKLMGLGL